MHRSRNKMLFYSAAAVAGLASLALHRYMMAGFIDEKGLLIRWNLPQILLLVLGAGFVLGAGLLVRTLGGDGDYEDNFPRNMLNGALLLAAGLLLAVAAPGLKAPEQTAAPVGYAAWLAPFLTAGGQGLPWLAAGSMAVLGVFRMTERKPGPVFGGLVCLFYMMMLVRNYQLWSADPQLQDYAYQLLAGVLLMLCAFHRTCCDAGIIQRRKLIMTGLTAAVCCVAALSMPFQQNFYLASALWGLGCICDCPVLPPDPEPAEETEPEAEEA